MSSLFFQRSRYYIDINIMKYYEIFLYSIFVDIYLTENNFSGQPFQYYDTGQSLSEHEALQPYPQYQPGGRH
jgi:hypothetical protein